MPLSGWVNRSKSNKASKLFSTWSKLFTKAVECDTRQHTTMAVSLYSKISEDMSSFLETGVSELNNIQKVLTVAQKATIKNVSNSIISRIDVLEQNTLQQCQFTIEDMIKLKPVIKNILNEYKTDQLEPRDDCSIFSRTDSEVKSFSSFRSSDSGISGVSSDSDDEGDIKEIKELEPDNRLPRKTGLTRMAIKIDKISLENTSLKDPCITISVRDSVSVHLMQHYAYHANNITNSEIKFDANIEIQRYIENIPKGSRVFFELKHRKEGKVKTKCFAVLPKNSFKPGSLCLELYKGPTDFHMKKLKKFSSKQPLYLYVEVKLLD